MIVRSLLYECVTLTYAFTSSISVWEGNVIVELCVLRSVMGTAAPVEATCVQVRTPTGTQNGSETPVRDDAVQRITKPTLSPTGVEGESDTE